MEIKKFSPERLFNIRRLRKARRLFKIEPLFALADMQAFYPGYSQQDLLQDLRRRTPPIVRRGKSPLMRFGRYQRMESLMGKFHQTRDFTFAQQAITLRAKITRPYQVRVKLEGQIFEYSYSALIRMEDIEQLNLKFRCCKTSSQVKQIHEDFCNRPYC